MSLRINNNIAAINALRNLGSTTLQLATAAKFLGLLTTLINHLETQHAKCAEANR